MGRRTLLRFFLKNILPTRCGRSQFSRKFSQKRKRRQELTYLFFPYSSLTKTLYKSSGVENFTGFPSMTGADFRFLPKSYSQQYWTIQLEQKFSSVSTSSIAAINVRMYESRNFSFLGNSSTPLSAFSASVQIQLCFPQ